MAPLYAILTALLTLTHWFCQWRAGKAEQRRMDADTALLEIATEPADLALGNPILHAIATARQSRAIAAAVDEVSAAGKSNLGWRKWEARLGRWKEPAKSWWGRLAANAAVYMAATFDALFGTTYVVAQAFGLDNAEVIEWAVRTVGFGGS